MTGPLLHPDTGDWSGTQAEGLATAVKENAQTTRRTKRVVRAARKAVKRTAPPIWSIAGGKGGTGKSVITANLGIGLALLGKRVILIDGDLGGPNLHNYLNLRRPKHNLNDFISNRVGSLSEVISRTPLETLQVISGGTELLGAANLNHQKKEKLLRHIRALEADYVLVDLGAGTTFNTIDFFNLSSRGFIIINPEPNAKYDAFYFLKNSVFRKLARKLGANTTGGKLLKRYIAESNGNVEIPRFLDLLAEESPATHATVGRLLQSTDLRLVMNKVRNRRQRREGEWFIGLVEKYLGITMELAGYVGMDKKVQASSEEIVPFLFRFPKCGASRDLFDILNRLDMVERGPFGASFRGFRKAAVQSANLWPD